MQGLQGSFRDIPPLHSGPMQHKLCRSCQALLYTAAVRTTISQQCTTACMRIPLHGCTQMYRILLGRDADGSPRLEWGP